METMLLLAIVGKNGGVESLDELKSPVINYPPDLEPTPATDRSTRVLTERALKNTHLAWTVRKRNLAARLQALENAQALGRDSTWSGDVSDVHIRSVKEALAEAHWVEARLREAARWCSERPLESVSLRKLIKEAKNGNRPSHSDYPLVLHDLPFPLPEAPPSSVYTLTVERPPPVDYERTEYDHTGDTPPTYSPEVDFSSGELSVERGSEVVDYQRRIDGTSFQLRNGRTIGSADAFPHYWGV